MIVVHSVAARPWNTGRSLPRNTAPRRGSPAGGVSTAYVGRWLPCALELPLQLALLAFRRFHDSGVLFLPGEKMTIEPGDQIQSVAGQVRGRIPACGDPRDTRSPPALSTPASRSRRSVRALSTIRSWPASISRAGWRMRAGARATRRSMKKLAASRPAVPCRRL